MASSFNWSIQPSGGGNPVVQGRCTMLTNHPGGIGARTYDRSNVITVIAPSGDLAGYYQKWEDRFKAVPSGWNA